ncbi:MAG: hypothetical protein AB1451_05085 [Nitrospirota bacterium]
MGRNGRVTPLVAIVGLVSALGGYDRALSEGTTAQPDAAPKGILVEVFLSPDHRDDIPAIKRDFEALSVTRLRTQVFRLGHPPKNIAIGRDVPAPVAQLAIRLAVAYNGGVEFLLPQYRFFPSHVAIGTSAFDEASQIPISPEGLEQLRDPTLTTEAFHELYRRLTGEAQRRPTYLE